VGKEESIKTDIPAVSKVQAAASDSWTASYSLEDCWMNNNGLALYYDDNKKDLYVITPSKALCYSEYIGQFTSFLNYEGGVLFNIGSTFHALTNFADDGVVDFWKMFDGDYNQFFYKKHQTDFTFISNAESTTDKTFGNVEARADFYDKKGELQHTKFFDTIQVADEYQDTGEVKLSNVRRMALMEHTPNTQKKFRVWRCDIPRALKNGRRSMDRIRNTWCKIKLAMNKDTSEDAEASHAEIHDVQVVYYN